MKLLVSIFTLTLYSCALWAGNGLGQSGEPQQAREKMCDVVLGKATCSLAQASVFRTSIDILKMTCSSQLQKSGCEELARELGSEVR
jgi:hypothetical protein